MKCSVPWFEYDTECSQSINAFTIGALHPYEVPFELLDRLSHKCLNQSIFTNYIEILWECDTAMIPLKHHELCYEFTFIQGNNQCHRDRIIPSLKQIHTHIHTKEMTSVIVTGSYLLWNTYTHIHTYIHTCTLYEIHEIQCMSQSMIRNIWIYVNIWQILQQKCSSELPTWNP